MKLLWNKIEIRIALVYFLFGCLWILLSDRILFFFLQDPSQLTKIQTYKGWFFVSASALLVYLLLKHYLKIKRQTEQDLRENAERLQLALDAAQQGIYDLNVQTGQTIVTDIYATMLGYDPLTFEETNQRWLERMHPDDVPPVQKTYLDYTEGKIPEYRVEFRQKTAAGEWKWVLSLGKIVEYDQEGRPLRMLGTHTDITESKNAALKIAQLILSLQTAQQELVEAYDATIEGWSKAMDLRDHETEGHTLRVTHMSMALAQKMGLTEAAIAHIRRGALLHDIGKMGIPDGILLKPGLLTAEERTIIQHHPRYAFDMLRSIGYLRPALEIPHYHHEKWDGSGYPYGLKAADIPLAARMFAIIDVYDALTSDRPYRRAWSEQEANAYIAEQSGKHFDPDLVPIFLDYLKENLHI